MRHPAAGARSEAREAKRKRAAAAATTEADEDDGGAADTADATSADPCGRHGGRGLLLRAARHNVDWQPDRAPAPRRGGCPSTPKRVAIGPLVLDATAGGGGGGGASDGEAAIGAGLVLGRRRSRSGCRRRSVSPAHLARLRSSRPPCG